MMCLLVVCCTILVGVVDPFIVVVLSCLFHCMMSYYMFVSILVCMYLLLSVCSLGLYLLFVVILSCMIM